MPLTEFKGLEFKGSENGCASLRIIAEEVRVANVRVESVDLVPSVVRDYLTITVSLQHKR